MKIRLATDCLTMVGKITKFKITPVSKGKLTVKNIKRTSCSKFLVNRLTAYSVMAGAVLACMSPAEGKIIGTDGCNASLSICDLIPQNQQLQGQKARYERQIGFHFMSSGSNCTNPPPTSNGE